MFREHAVHWFTLLGIGRLKGVVNIYKFEGHWFMASSFDNKSSSTLHDKDPIDSNNGHYRL